MDNSNISFFLSYLNLHMYFLVKSVSVLTGLFCSYRESSIFQTCKPPWLQDRIYSFFKKPDYISTSRLNNNIIWFKWYIPIEQRFTTLGALRCQNFKKSNHLKIHKVEKHCCSILLFRYSALPPPLHGFYKISQGTEYWSFWKSLNFSYKV